MQAPSHLVLTVTACCDAIGSILQIRTGRGCHCPGSHSRGLSPGRGALRLSPGVHDFPPPSPHCLPLSLPCEPASLADLSEEEVALRPVSSAPLACSRAAVGAASLCSPLANLIQKLLLGDPMLGPPGPRAPAQGCLRLLEGWGPDSPSAQTVLQVPRSLPTFFP